jgi:septum formation protein
MGLVLASESASRLNLLKSAGLDVAAQPSVINEQSIKDKMLAKNATTAEIAQYLAEQKALKVSALRKHDIIIGADQILQCGGQLFDKAENIKEAETNLKKLRGKEHKLVTAVVLARNEAIIWSYVAVPTLTMRKFSDQFLYSYIDNAGSALTRSVGAYYLEERGVQLFSKIDGDYHAILGLPLVPLLNKLRELKLIDD